MRTTPIAAIALLAAGIATASTAQPVYPRLPVFVYDSQSDAATTNAVRRDCTQLELSAGINEAECGTIPLSIVAQLKAEADEDGDDD